MLFSVVGNIVYKSVSFERIVEKGEKKGKNFIYKS